MDSESHGCCWIWMPGNPAPLFGIDPGAIAAFWRAGWRRVESEAFGTFNLSTYCVTGMLTRMLILTGINTDGSYFASPILNGYALELAHRSQDYRTCPECGGDYSPEHTGVDGLGVRIAFVCPEHGVQSIVDPFDDKR